MTTIGNIEYVDLGNFPEGEIPDPLEYTYLDADGAAIPLTGGTVTFTIQRDDEAEAVGLGAIDNSQFASGIVGYAWHATDMSVPGHYEGWFTAEVGAQKFISYVIRWWVYAL